MVEIRPSNAEELKDQKALWKAAFGDDEAYIDLFYRTCAKPQDIMILTEDGVLRSMLALLPLELELPDGERLSSAYVYALATDPNARKQGHGRALLRYSELYLRERDVDCITVVPAEAGLFKFFETVDFTDCFSTRKLELLESMIPPAPAGSCLEAVGAAAYGGLRERLLAGTFHTQYGEALLAFQEGVSHLSGGGLYRVVIDGREGCAAVEYTGNSSLVIKELLVSPSLMENAVSLLKESLQADRYFIRTPALWDGLPGSYIQPFAMIKWLKEDLRQAWSEERAGYFGLGFD
ncbi:GNAT family N-acetyltransferase [uncultured Pseudoflavonifractor sp.]|uniref:GNAT family N-acetyltransferase n=1 Tax=uncultured Pseudoflavonifractor sp. TaxID=1221379 RepID=UPI0025EEC844|nr:GNAT family N-acetyltransferase [uncultured Pseudoflavonifractor sp.]